MTCINLIPASRYEVHKVSDSEAYAVEQELSRPQPDKNL